MRVRLVMCFCIMCMMMCGCSDNVNRRVKKKLGMHQPDMHKAENGDEMLQLPASVFCSDD